ncbi:MAG: flagellar assembly protein FliW [Oscillospiraceae bacterium]
MKILTRDFGEFEIEKNDIISFPAGLYAFEEEHEFVIISQDELPDVYWLQSVNNSDLCFILFNPQQLLEQYTPIYQLSTLETIDAKSNSDLKYFVIGVIKEDFSLSTVNLKSPIVVNQDNNKALQIICENEDYSVKYPLVKSSQREV